jgi:hypothetical protein
MLYFKPFDLRLRQNEEGEHVIEQSGTVTRTFSSEKKAVVELHLTTGRELFEADFV